MDSPSTALYFSWISTILGGPGCPVAFRGTLGWSRLFSQKLSARPWALPRRYGVASERHYALADREHFRHSHSDICPVPVGVHFVNLLGAGSMHTPCVRGDHSHAFSTCFMLSHYALRNSASLKNDAYTCVQVQNYPDDGSVVPTVQYNNYVVDTVK